MTLADRRGIRRRLLGAAALASLGVMLLELTFVRLLAPYFGTSLYTWTNVIGVVLVALAAGYALGGRLADRAPDPQGLVPLLVVATILLLPMPWAAPALSGWMLPPSDALSPLVATGHLVRGSLALTLLLLGAPMLLLGIVSPWITRALADTGLAEGKAAGRTLAVSAVASLVGTYLPALVLVPALGSPGTCWLGAAVVAAAAVPLATGWRSRGLATALGLFALVLALLGGGGPLRGPLEMPAGGPQEESVVAELESPYQYLRLSRWSVPDASPQLRLSIDEGVTEFHSVLAEEGVLTGGYYDDFAVLPELLPAEGDRDPDVLILGGGAGTMPRMLRALHPGRLGWIVSAEIDPVVQALGPRFGWHPGPMDLDLSGDGRMVLRSLDHRWDLVILDAYARQIAIPAHLATVELARLVASRLRPEGLFAVNVSTHDLQSPLFAALVRTLGEVFPEVVAVSVPGSWNVVLLASPQEGRRFEPSGGTAALEPVRRRFLEGLIPEAGLPEGGRLLSDDRAPLEQLARMR